MTPQTNSEFVTFNEIQTQYIKLYRLLRQYIWEYQVVEHIGELEVQAFTAFADRIELKAALARLIQDIKATDVWAEDEELRQCFDDFNTLLNTGETAIPLKTFKEMQIS